MTEEPRQFHFTPTFRMSSTWPLPLGTTETPLGFMVPSPSIESVFGELWGEIVALRKRVEELEATRQSSSPLPTLESPWKQCVSLDKNLAAKCMSGVFDEPTRPPLAPPAPAPNGESRQDASKSCESESTQQEPEKHCGGQQCRRASGHDYEECPKPAPQ